MKINFKNSKKVLQKGKNCDIIVGSVKDTGV